MNHPSKTSIPIDQRKWNDIPPVSYAKKESPAWLESLREGDKSVSTSRSTERLIGALCSLCYAAISKMKVPELSRIHNGWVLYIEEATRQDFSIAWMQARISFTSEPFKVIQEELWLIPYCWTMFKFRCTLQARLIAGGKDTKEGHQTVFFTALDPCAMNPTGSIKSYRNHERYNTKVSGQ